MSAGSSGSNDSDRDIDPSLNSVKLANFILFYGLRTVVQLVHSLLVSSVSVFFFDVGCIPVVYVHLVCVDRSLFCQYCWNADGLGVTVELLCLRLFICRGVEVVSLCLNTSFVVTKASLFAFNCSMRWAFLLLVEGERYFFSGPGW